MLFSVNPTLIIALSIILATIVIILTIASIGWRYKNFINRYSVGLKILKEINEKYRFKDVKNRRIDHSYDNQNMYDDISCTDYLTYQLIYEQKDILKKIRETETNKNLFEKYNDEITRKVEFNVWSTENLLKMKKYLAKKEAKMISQNVRHPNIDFKIFVYLRLTNINGEYRGQKECVFNAVQINRIIERLEDKNGKFYNNKDIWDSICRVERGKVTNKIRFAVYQRDGYRCQICQRKTDDLEVDHIYPISKGGKSTMDNLQTLCHRCNVEKGAKVLIRK